jgi:hypothetical protein
MKTFSQDNGVPAEIKTKHLHNTNLERYCYVNPLGSDQRWSSQLKARYDNVLPGQSGRTPQGPVVGILQWWNDD